MSSGFYSDFNELSDTLKRNSFPSYITDKTFKQYLKSLLFKAVTLMMITIHAISSFSSSVTILEYLELYS